MEFVDPKVFDDPKGISIGSMDFDCPKVYGDTSIFDGFHVCILLQSSARPPVKRCSQCNRACFEVLGGVCTIFSIHKSPYSYLLSLSCESVGL